MSQNPAVDGVSSDLFTLPWQLSKYRTRSPFEHGTTPEAPPGGFLCIFV